MAINPEAQERAYKEASCLMEGRPSKDVIADDLNRIPYIKACLKESLRLVWLFYMNTRTHTLKQLPHRTDAYYI